MRAQKKVHCTFFFVGKMEGSTASMMDPSLESVRNGYENMEENHMPRKRSRG